MKVTALMCMSAILWAIPVQAQITGNQKKLPGIGLDFSVEYVEAYVFRGQVRDVESGYNTDFTIGAGSMSYNYFSHRTSGSSDFDYTENVHSLEMTWARRGASQTMGYRYTQCSDINSLYPDTQEFFFKVAYDSPWHPSFGTFLDIDAYKGYYFDLSMDRYFPVSRKSLLGLKLYIAGANGMTEESDRSGTIYEYGYFGDNGITNGFAKLYWRWFPSNRWGIEVAYRAYKAFDDLLDADPKTAENDQIVSFKLRYIFP